MTDSMFHKFLAVQMYDECWRFFFLFLSLLCVRRRGGTPVSDRAWLYQCSRQLLVSSWRVRYRRGRKRPPDEIAIARRREQTAALSQYSTLGAPHVVWHACTHIGMQAAGWLHRVTWGREEEMMAIVDVVGKRKGGVVDARTCTAG